jgi:hypothetical protein
MTDTFTYHHEPSHLGGKEYIRCEGCGSESIPARPAHILHDDDCPVVN